MWLLEGPSDGIYSVMAGVPNSDWLNWNTRYKRANLEKLDGRLQTWFVVKQKILKNRNTIKTPSNITNTLNWMSTFRFVFVPSGHRKSCGNCWSDDWARAFMSSLALCRLSGVLLSTKMVWLNNWHVEMRNASRDSILLTGDAPHIIIMTAWKRWALIKDLITANYWDLRSMKTLF